MRGNLDPTYLGVDWASGRWVVVGVDGDSVTVTTEPSILNVWHEYRQQPRRS